MLDQYLTEKQYDAMFAAGASSVLRKQAVAPAANIGTLAILKKFLGGARDFVSGGHKFITTGADDAGKIVDLLAKLALTGSALGAVGGVGYNLAKTRVSQGSPEEDMNRNIEAMYKIKSRELEDAKWISKVRAMRDDLKRNYKKMTTEEYSKKYSELANALDERSGDVRV